MATTPGSQEETSLGNSTTTTTTTSSHDGEGDSTQAVYFTVSFTLVGIAVAGFCSAVYIWRHKRRTGKTDSSCYRDKNTVGDRNTKRIESKQESVEMFPCNTLDSRCSFGNSDAQNNRGDFLRKDITSDYGYCTITSLAEPLPSVPNNSSLKQPATLLTVNLYDKIQTTPNKSKAKLAASAWKTKLNAYDHVIPDDQHVQIKEEGESASPVTSTLENSSLRLNRGRRSNRKDSWRKDISEIYTSADVSKRYVVLESDGFYFVNDETET